ncbi:MULTISPECIES: RNA 2',3'-cyclic phosphodiesterase [Streptomycetaceae]|uniref:RNA 2',3'-cyclic phosphodiesterase n=1 Tax=Streptomycetaceae TaxID=2062 RepID=UPI0005A156DD|nr:MULTISPECIES: RNA 2',3'-cyclic phosphodiesterase [Streptomycetaceae]MYS59392.1 RNA 2',3'-cyclic phosphodiesterase [Streptomyces sp. SID5468]
MRLFVAVAPPDEALRELGDVVDGLRALPGADALRWTGPEQWHLTLAFLGEVAEDTLPDLRERLARAARRHPPARLRLAGGGRFGDRVLWAGVTGHTPELGRLAASVNAAARHAGIALDEERRFTAHLTLARNRGHTRLRPFAEPLADFAGRDWTAREIALIRSNLPAPASAAPGAPGPRPRYQTLGTWPLGH